MSSSRKRAYKHKAYAEIDHLKQKLMMVEHHHYSIMEKMARKAASMVDEHKAALKQAALIAHEEANEAKFNGVEEACIRIEEAILKLSENLA